MKLNFEEKKIVIGMIHLLPSIGYPSYKGYKETLEYALADLKSLVGGGINAVLVENDNDQPHQVEANPEIISFMTLIISEIVKESSVPVGVEVLLNDPKASLAIAKVTGCQFIRTDYFVDKMTRKEYGGEMSIDPEGLANYQGKIDAKDISLFTDIQVKYAKLLEKNKSIQDSCSQAIDKGSDGVVVTGAFTGIQPDIKKLKHAKEVAENIPIIIGSGFSANNARELLKHADGAIVGSSIKEDNFNSPVSKKKVEELMNIVNNI